MDHLISIVLFIFIAEVLSEVIIILAVNLIRRKFCGQLIDFQVFHRHDLSHRIDFMIFLEQLIFRRCPLSLQLHSQSIILIPQIFNLDFLLECQ